MYRCRITPWARGNTVGPGKHHGPGETPWALFEYLEGLDGSIQILQNLFLHVLLWDNVSHIVMRKINIFSLLFPDLLNEVVNLIFALNMNTSIYCQYLKSYSDAFDTV